MSGAAAVGPGHDRAVLQAYGGLGPPSGDGAHGSIARASSGSVHARLTVSPTRASWASARNRSMSRSTSACFEITLAVKQVEDTREFGVVLHDADGRITGFQEKPDCP